MRTSRRSLLVVFRRQRLSSDASVQEVYERITPLEHILLRPGMYIGQVNVSAAETWIYNVSNKKMEKKVVQYSPALIKIFDEILVNAADNYKRDSKMTSLRVTVSDELLVSIWNDGRGIPIEIHSKENIYVPELIFGHLYTGSNFDDSKNSITGGRHGFGAKLTNIFSNSFEIETCNHKSKLLYHQGWKKNMSVTAPASITKLSKKPKSDYTKITFTPDLTKFDMTKIGSGSALFSNILQDTVALYRRRVIDIAACLNKVQVSFNDEAVPVQCFEDYCKLFATAAEEAVFFFVSANKRWHVGVTASPSGSFEHMSFVNSIWTPGGGSHVAWIAAQVTQAIEEELARKGVKASSAAAIRNKLMIFVNCDVENPSFDSQSKNSLTTKHANFGADCVLSKVFFKKIVQKSHFVSDLIDDLKVRADAQLLRASRVSKKASASDASAIVVAVPKLEDAHDASSGGKKSLACTLILTEGDSAKALAVSGLEVLGREQFGVMPLRGKILNVRQATKEQLLKNQEIMNICKAVGLDFSKTYRDGLANQGLRYGSVLLMCDQDADGSHIKGLLLNFFDHFWPRLLHVEGFLQQFITPLVKVRPKGGGSNGEISAAATERGKKRKGKVDKGTDSAGDGGESGVKVFYSMQEYLAWRQMYQQQQQGKQKEQQLHNSSDSVEPDQIQNSEKSSVVVDKKYDIKYYKGLGTNTAAEGRVYFKALNNHRKIFYSEGRESETIDMAFSKLRIEDRKVWLSTTYDPNYFMDASKERISYEEFINKELIQYSHADIVRSIPSVVDGLKPSQRKVMYACFKKNLTSEMKVVQLAGYISEQTAYHHGEASLHTSIIRMAQDFPGSNNLPYLVAAGQFGTRAEGGDDYASPRYIFTRLSPFVRALFPEHDDSQLEYLEEDGISVEPKYYVPIIPTILVNGSAGIGTGWSTSIPPFNPTDVIDHVEHRVKSRSSAKAKALPAPALLTPWIKGHNGTITENKAETSGSRSYTSWGTATVVGDTVSITELPYCVWTKDYKSHLVAMCADGRVRSFRESHSSSSVSFSVRLSEAALADFTALTGASKSVAPRSKSDCVALSTAQLEYLKLKSSIKLSNMHAFDRHSNIKRFVSPEEILDEHFEVRLDAYRQRKEALARKLRADDMLYRNKSAFISAILDGRITLLGSSGDAGGDGKGMKATKNDSSRGGVDVAVVLAQLRKLEFATSSDIARVLNGEKNTAKKGRAVASNVSDAKEYGYLLDLPIQSLTEQRRLALQKQAETATADLQALLQSTEEELWLKDLAKLRAALN